MVQSPVVIYEQPLNERVRTCLRLEHLFALADACRARPTEWDSRAAITSLIDVTDLLARSDVKTELIKELQRLGNRLDELSSNPAIDPGRLREWRAQTVRLTERLMDKRCMPGQSLRQNELLASVQNRRAIPGGSCRFDLPAYYHWLNKPSEQRRQQLQDWMDDIDVIKESIEVILRTLRAAAHTSQELAAGGFFQKVLDPDSDCKLVRVVPQTVCAYPEISGGRHRFSVRFLEQPTTWERATQSADDISFELHCCLL